MFKALKDFFKTVNIHKHTDSVSIRLLSSSTHTRIFGGYFHSEEINLGRYISGNLHRCLKCGELTDLGLSARLNGEKVGNFYSLRQSLKLARELSKLGYPYQLMKLYKKKLSIRRVGNSFEFYEK